MKKLLLSFCLFSGSLFYSATLQAQIKVPKGAMELKKSPANGGMMKRVMYKQDLDKKDDYVTVIAAKDKPNEDVKILFYQSKEKKLITLDLMPAGEKEILMFPLRVVKNELEFSYGMNGSKNFARFVRLAYDSTLNQLAVVTYETYIKEHDISTLKAYNLKSGEFKITYNNLDNSTNQIHRSAKFGTQKVETVSIEQLNDTFFDTLDEIMLAKEIEVPESTKTEPVKEKSNTKPKSKKKKK
ncbi:MAG: hypothetical protein EOP54_01000 [Sphingobacteriales bacterium]|nr:MAG: hypothetical protein EOP54_01000 [Sphingobacteriales bacterium]